MSAVHLTRDQRRSDLDRIICPLTLTAGFMDAFDAALAGPDHFAAVDLCRLNPDDYTVHDLRDWAEWRERIQVVTESAEIGTL